MGNPNVGRVHPDAVVDRQAVDGPRVLRVNAVVVGHISTRERRVIEHLDRFRRANQTRRQPCKVVDLRTVGSGINPRHHDAERIRVITIRLIQMRVRKPGLCLTRPGVLEANLHVVRTGDVGHRPDQVLLERVVDRAATVRTVFVEAKTVVLLRGPDTTRPAIPRVTGRGLNEMLRAAHGREARSIQTGLDASARVGLLHLRLVTNGIDLTVGRETKLGQHTIRQGAGPLGASRVIEDWAPLLRGVLDVVALAVLVEPHLTDPVEIGGELVAGIGLVGQPHQTTGQPVVIDARAPVAVEAVKHDQVGRPVTYRTKEPQLIPDDGAAQGGVEVIHTVNPGHAVTGIALLFGLDAHLAKALVPDTALPAAVRATEVARAAERVTTILRDHVDSNTATLGVGARARGREGRLRVHLRIEIHLIGTVADGRVDLHAVDEHRGVHTTGAVAIHQHLLHGARATDVRQARADTRHQGAKGVEAVPSRDRLEGLTGEHLGSVGLLNIDNRRFARDRDGLFDRADAQYNVQIQGHVRRESHVVTDLSTKTRQVIRNGVTAGP